MTEYAGWQKQYLKSLAHHLKPMIQLGKLGMTPSLIEMVKKTLDDHELIKVRFLAFKDERQHISERLSAATDSLMVGLIGNVLTLYRENPKPDKRKIVIPSNKS
jgi:RNA-binding protein